MSKMSNLAIDIEKKYTLRVGQGVKCQSKEEAEILAYAMKAEGKLTKIERKSSCWWLGVTEVLR